MESTEELVTHIRTALTEKNIQNLKSLCEEQKHEALIKSNPYDIISEIIQCINEQLELEHADFLKEYASILNKILEKCDPEDAVLTLHKEISHTNDDTTFTHLLVPLKNAITNLPEKRSMFIVWCFNAIQSFVDALPLPDNLNLEEKERILMDSDSDVHRISTIYLSINDFCQGIKINSLAFCKFLLNLLGKPLVFLDLRVANKTKSRGRRVAESLIGLFVSLSNPFNYLTWRNNKKSVDDEIEIKLLGLSNLFYLIISENVCIESIPKVYDPLFIFQSGLHFVVELFEHNHQFVTEKGLILSESLINLVKGSTPLQYLLLDDTVHCKFCSRLSQIMIYSPLIEYRQKAVKIFTRYLFLFDSRGRYLLTYNIFNTIQHKSIRGHLIAQYKEMFELEYAKSALGEYFKGTNLCTLVKMFCYLEKREESDLLELYDQIVSTLNLLRYIMMRDVHNYSKIHDLIPSLEEDYLGPLKKGLILTKAHYDLKIKDTKEAAAGNKVDEDSKFSVTVGDSDLPNMTFEEKMNALQSSMNAFDIIECLLQHVTEIIDQIKIKN